MSNDLIYALIGESELPQIEQLWTDGVSDEVFLPFFACFIANLADDGMNAWYQKFIQATDTAYGTAIATGSGLMGSDAYWQNGFHAKLAQRIAEATLVDSFLLRVAFPLATHAGFDYIAEQADLMDMSVQEFAKTKLNTIAPSLPAWADEVVAPAVLSQVSVASLVNKTLQNDLGVSPTALDDDVFLVEHLELSDGESTDKVALPPTTSPISTQAVELDNLVPSLQNSRQDNDELVLDFSDNESPLNLPTFPTPKPKISALSNANINEVDLGTDELISLVESSLADKVAADKKHADERLLDDLMVELEGLVDNTPHNDPIPPAPSVADLIAKKQEETKTQPIPNLDEILPTLVPEEERNELFVESDESDEIAPVVNKKSKVIGGRIGDGKKGGSTALKIGVPILLLLVLAGGGGFWYYQNHLNAPAPDPEPSVAVVAQPTIPSAPPLPVESLPPSSLSLTVDEHGGLYACRAELGNDGLLNQVYGLLQTNFNNTVCAMDVNGGVSQTMVGLDKLTSVIGVLKTSPFASLELSGDTLWIHSPNAEEVNRLVTDMNDLMAGVVKVIARPPLNKSAEIDASIAKASSVLSALPQNADAHSLARAMSVPIFDVNSGVIADANLQLLASYADRLKAKTDTRLIIAVHSEDTGDKVAARQQTKAYAELIKKALLDLGVTDFQLVAQGVGYDFPIMDNHTDLGRFKNNRVEFLVYDDAVFNALNAPAVQPAQPASEVAVEQLPPAQQVQPQPQPQAPVVVAEQLPPQPTYGVVNGQIVEQGLPQANPPAQFAPIQAPQPSISISSGNGGIDEDLLRPIGTEVGVGTSSQVH